MSDKPDFSKLDLSALVFLELDNDCETISVFATTLNEWHELLHAIARSERVAKNAGVPIENISTLIFGDGTDIFSIKMLHLAKEAVKFVERTNPTLADRWPTVVASELADYQDYLVAEALHSNKKPLN